MAKLERTLYGRFPEIVEEVVTGIMRSSLSATLEDASDFSDGISRCSVRVFERYSAFGGNRVSLNVTLFQGTPDGPVRLCAVSSGGSQAVFYKINTLGEEAFLDKLRVVSDRLAM